MDTNFTLPRWEQLPSISLYMDQVILVLDDAVGDLAADGPIKPTMVNNYVKHKAVPPPDKKKYDRERLARLIMISILKRALSIGETAALMNGLAEAMGMEQAYDLFVDRLKQMMGSIADRQPLPILAENSHGFLDAALLTLAGKLLVEEYFRAAEAESQD